MTPEREGLGRTVLVTGASAGIGAELARVFAAHGFDLVRGAGGEEGMTGGGKGLGKKSAVQTGFIPADLARRETPANLVSALERDGVVIDALINNAGYAVPGHYRDTDWEAQ